MSMIYRHGKAKLDLNKGRSTTIGRDQGAHIFLIDQRREPLKFQNLAFGTAPQLMQTSVKLALAKGWSTMFKCLEASS